MHKWYFTWILVVLLQFSCEQPQESNAPKSNPNIIVILADDMGYSDLGCYGGEINTPNLDTLATNGLRFTQFYNAARCCPTRASLLTGLYPHQAGMGGMVKQSESTIQNPYQGYLNRNNITLAEALKFVGYRTYLSGKWHVGEFRPVWPVDRGFDRSYGLISGAMNYWNISKGKRKDITRTFVEDSTVINNQINNGFYSTEAFTNKALSYLKDHFQKSPASPFFLYLAYQAPHWPLHAPEAYIQKYIGKYQKGWDAIRKERFNRMKQLGILHQQDQLSPIDSQAADWDNLTAEQKDTMDRKMAVYAAMIEIMDENIGRIIQQLKTQKELDNTLILFLSDNGASSESGALGHNFRPDLKGPIGAEDSYHSYGLSWANASNTPYRKFKASTYEGGFATPLIVHWNNQIKNKGSIIQAQGHIIDIMATFLDLTKMEYPTSIGSDSITPIQGKSLLPLIQATTPNIRSLEEPLCWEHQGNKAIIQGDWKMVRTKQDSNWQLYHLPTDRIEGKNLALKEPERVMELDQLYKKWALKVGAK